MTSLSPLLKQATPVVVDHASGSWIHGTDGEDYLDFTTGIGVTSTGHCHPRVVAAAREQVGKVIHAQYTTVMHKPLLELTEKLGEVLPDRARLGVLRQLRLRGRRRRRSGWPGWRPAGRTSSCSKAVSTAGPSPRRA